MEKHNTSYLFRKTASGWIGTINTT